MVECLLRTARALGSASSPVENQTESLEHERTLFSCLYHTIAESTLLREEMLGFSLALCTQLVCSVLKTSFNVPRVHLEVAILLRWSGIYCPACFSLLCAELTDRSHHRAWCSSFMNVILSVICQGWDVFEPLHDILWSVTWIWHSSEGPLGFVVRYFSQPVLVGLLLQMEHREQK